MHGPMNVKKGKDYFTGRRTDVRVCERLEIKPIQVSELNVCKLHLYIKLNTQFLFSFFAVALRPNAGHGLLILVVF